MKHKIVNIFLTITLSSISIILALTGCTTIPPETDPIMIGAVGPMNYDAGKLIFYGCEMAVDDINASGGVTLNGQKHLINLIKIDTNEMMSVTDAAAAIEKAITTEKATCLIGGNKLDAALEEQDKAVDLSTIFISTGNTDPEQSMKLKKDYKRYQYWFRTCLNTVYSAYYLNAHAAFIADILKKELRIQELKAVLITDKGSSGDSIVNFWEKSLPELGIEVVATYRPNASASDLTTEINGIKESGAQIVMQMLTGAAGSAFAGKWGELQIPAVLLGVNFSAQSKTIIEATPGRMNYMATGALISNAAITAKTIPFFNRFSEKYKDYPGYGGASYDAVWIYKEAVEKAGSLYPDKVVSMLEKTDFTGVTNRITFGDMNTPFPHDMLSSQTKGYAILPLVQWINGEQVSVWPPDLKGSQKYRNLPWIGISK